MRLTYDMFVTHPHATRWITKALSPLVFGVLRVRGIWFQELLDPSAPHFDSARDFKLVLWGTVGRLLTLCEVQYTKSDHL